MTAIDPPETCTSQNSCNESLDLQESQIQAQCRDKAETGERGSFDIPRPLLTIQQAAAFLGKSVRALERSLMGRWGNKLPEGWNAKKIRTDNGEEWRIMPPPGFRIRSHHTGESSGSSSTEAENTRIYSSHQESGLPAGRRMYLSEHSLEQPTIVIDRSEEVENLLRELLSTQKALSEERRLHMEDLRIVAQLQGSMRLLETNAAENSRARQDLADTRRELEGLKQEYNQLLNLPWWKRLFAFKRS